MIFFNDTFNGNRWWFYEVGKIPPAGSGRTYFLREGFSNEVIHTDRQGWIGSYRRFSQILRQEKPKAVLTYGYYLPEHWLLLWLCRRLSIPLLFVGETFGLGNLSFRRLIKAPLQGYFMRRVAQFVAIGDKTANHYKQLGIPEGKITPAKYCTDVSFFRLPAEVGQDKRRRWRDTLGIPQSAFVILFVGRLFERKRPLDVIHLFHRLSEIDNLYAVIVGNGPLWRRASPKSATDRSRVALLGFQDQGETRDAYCGADLLIVPSEYETWGLVVNEAAAAGIPSLVTENCGVARDLVIPGETGFVYPVGDIAAAAAHVKKLAQEPELAKEMGIRARDRVTRLYSIEQFADAIVLAADRVTKSEV